MCADINHSLQHVWKDQWGEYQFRRYIDKLTQQEDGNQFRVFALKQLMFPVSEKSIDLQIRDLNLRVVILGQKTPSKI